jgi:hypothetical protein
MTGSHQNRVPLRTVLAGLTKAGVVPPEEFPAYFGRREVRVVEVLDGYVMIQPVDNPRSWEIAPVELITVSDTALLLSSTD